MQFYLIAVLLSFTGGVCAAVLRKQKKLALVFGAGSLISAAFAAGFTAIEIMAGKSPTASFCLNLPVGPATIMLDNVSAFFVFPVVFVGVLCALYSASVSWHEKNSEGNDWFFMNLLFSSMLLLLCSANAFLFLIAWEIMSVAAYFLIVHRDEIVSARSAGWKFFIGSHIGTAGLMMMFAVLGSGSGSLEFAAFNSAAFIDASASVIFCLAIFGFGVKVGLLPLHVWMPDSYACADAHVSAFLSAAMSKMGFYGLIRIMMLAPVISDTWGWLMLAGGLLTGIFALITAMAQSDLKKVIAYSSMENAGIILMALGTAVLGSVWKNDLILFLGIAGALLHILNHSICKSLLFLASGAVYHGVGTRKVEVMGGLAHKMPVTAAAFGVGSAAIAGLPPFNAFLSEFLLFLAGLTAATTGRPEAMVLAVVLMGGLAMIGGLATACFARTFGLVFLGAPRVEKKHEAEEVNLAVKTVLVVPAVLMAGLPVLFPAIIKKLAETVNLIAQTSNSSFNYLAVLAEIEKPVESLSIILPLLLGLVILGWLIRKRFFSEGDVSDRPTWDCGFAAPDARMQYTSSSFSQPLVESFSAIVRPFRHGEKVSGLFPQHASYRTESPDSLFRYLITPIFSLFDRIMIPVRALQHGRLHLYICYLAITLLILLIWKGVSL